MVLDFAQLATFMATVEFVKRFTYKPNFPWDPDGVCRTHPATSLDGSLHNRQKHAQHEFRPDFSASKYKLAQPNMERSRGGHHLGHNPGHISTFKACISGARKYQIMKIAKFSGQFKRPSRASVRSRLPLHSNHAKVHALCNYTNKSRAMHHLPANLRTHRCAVRIFASVFIFADLKNFWIHGRVDS